MSDSNGLSRTSRIFVANVGANASHEPRGLRSPLRDDGSFTLVTIPEAIQRPGLVRYGAVPHLRAVVPERYWPLATHYDPEFESLTYGDNCGWAPRAAGLKACRSGDAIFFIARLVGSNGPVFALIGWLRVEAILQDARQKPERATLRRFRRNAHVRRALVDGAYWDGFWVFAGEAGSGLFRSALPVGREEAELLFRDRAGGAWDWRPQRTELQTIGSYTRSCRCVIDPAVDPGRAAEWWSLLEARQVLRQVPLGHQEAVRPDPADQHGIEQP